MKKKLVALTLSAVMALSLIGCGSQGSGGNQESSKDSSSQQESEAKESQEATGKEESSEEASGDSAGEPVTLRIWFQEPSLGDEGKIADYINELPQVKDLNVKIEICKWNWDRSNLPLQIAGDEQMDIGWDGGSDFISRVNMDAYADISEYLKNDPEFYNAIPESLWLGTTLRGGIYGVPTYKELGEQWALLVDKNVLQKTGIDAASIKTIADAEPLLKAMQEQSLGAMYIANYQESLKLGMFDAYDFTPYYLGVINRSDAAKVENLYETQKFADYVKLMYDWNQKGYIPEEALTDSVNWVNSQHELYGNYCLRYCSYAPYTEKNNVDYDLEPIFLEQPVVTNDATRGSIFGIYKKCKNPEKAYQFLKLWNTDPEIKNAITWGIPDVHYRLVDGQLEDLNKESSYMCMNWASGNVMLSYTTVNEPKDKYEQYEKWNQSAVPAADLGLVYNFDEVSDKVTNCTAVLEEYLTPLILGFVEPESGIEQLNQKLKDAGVEDVIAAQDAQYQDFLQDK